MELDKDDGIWEGEARIGMTTPRATLHVACDSSGGIGEISDLARDADPLRRLEAELQRAGDEHPDGERLHEQAWSLLEEAWGLVTECLVLRDGLLDACREIEQTMDGIQHRLNALPSAIELHTGQGPTTSEQDAMSGSNGAATP